MDTKVFCVYNLARGVFLSSKVTVADGANEPLKMLKALVSGLGLDAVSGLWLFPLNAAPLVPRLFPFDLLYLDRDHQVLDAGEILPGVEFPPFRHEVASALVLAHLTLQSTQTARGDRLMIGLEEEIERQIGAWDTSSTEPIALNGGLLGNGHSGNGHREAKTSGRGEAASSGLMSAVFTSQVSPAAIPAPDDGVLVAQRPEVAKATLDATESLQVIGEKLAHSYISEIAAKSPTDEAESPTPAETPVTITEVVLEPPLGAQVPLINGQHGFVEDLFSNWVDAPSSASAWIARNASLQSIGTDMPAPASVAPLLSGPETAAPREKKPELQPRREVIAAAALAETQKNEMVSKPEPVPANKLAPVAVSDPTHIAIPQAALAATFTVTQYGLWRASMPTIGSPDVAVQGPLVVTPGASVADAQSSNSGKTSASSSPAEMAKAPDSNTKAKSLKASEKVPASVSIAKPPQEKTLVPAAVDLRASVGQVSMPAAADVRPQVDAIKSTIEQVPDMVVGTAEQVLAAKAAAVVPDEVEITRREVPAAEKGNPAQTAEGLQKKPVDSKAILAAKTAASKQPDDEKEPTSTLQSELSLTQPLPGIRKTEQVGKPKISIQRADANRKAKEQPPSLGMRFKRWLNPVAPTNSDRRKAHRRYVPGMVAHYYTGGAPRPHDVADISMTGFYLLTEDRWMPDTMIQMTLQKPCAKGERKQSITVLSKIVRRGSDGVAAEFVMPESLDPHSHDVQPSQTTDRFSLARFL